MLGLGVSVRVSG